MSRAAKTCASCGRTFRWRRKWRDDWRDVRWCSGACRRRGVTAEDRALEAAILELLEERSASASLCPSEAARRVDPQGWRDLMEPARRAARRLVAADRLEITQRGQVVDPDQARGPVRLRRPRARL